MFMEDILDKLVNSTTTLSRIFNYNILVSFHEQNHRKLGLTQKQRSLLEKIFRQHSKKLSQIFNYDIDVYLNNPQYRLAMRSLDQGKYIVIENDQIFGKKFKITFPYDKNIITDLQNTKHNATLCNWDGENRAWTMPVVEKNILYLKNLAKNHEFSISNEIHSLFQQVDEIVANMENHVPIVVEENNDYFLQNFRSDRNLQGNDFIEKLFDARKKAVVHWDTKIEEKLENFDVSNTIKDFLQLAPHEKFTLKMNDIQHSDISYLVKNLYPCLVIIPASETLNFLQKTLKIINEAGFSMSDCSVMFRLPNATDKDFNQFVKDQKLNNPIHENTKVVFVSGKITKPVFESRLYFHSVLSYNSIFPHYGMNNFLKHQGNIISIE